MVGMHLLSVGVLGFLLVVVAIFVEVELFVLVVGLVGDGDVLFIPFVSGYGGQTRFLVQVGRLCKCLVDKRL